ncbi:MAG: hypothetical protein MJZ14_01155 [Paludibacteraceae bacterium]|nr:hypothetical protein [Paludibacteraceae bacterium]
MSDTHIQVNPDASTSERKTTLWPSKKGEQEIILKQLFEIRPWKVEHIENISGSNWHIRSICQDKVYNVNLYVASIRDEDRNAEEFKAQLGTSYPTGETDGMITVVLGIYTIDNGIDNREFILAGYNRQRFDFSTNPSMRGTKTKDLQAAKIFGFVKNDYCTIFQPCFLYYFLSCAEQESTINNTPPLKQILETPIANYITQYDDMLFEAGKKEDILQKKCDQYYKDKTFHSATLACSIFGILFAPHLEKLNIKPTGTTNFNAIGEGKNIGLFLRKFIQKGACPTLSPEDLELMKQYIDIFTNALKTKPFLLLAGISGTGKSQKVKELAYASCPNDKELRSDETKPGNYCLIEVKPNWHDSTELLGYWSNLSQKYMLTDFIRFAYKATKHPNVPFFLCLDEMNLAPVEQYFAEYLSVLESRKVVAGKIVTEPLITKDIFKNCNLTKDGQYAYTAEDASIIEELQKDGLRLPDNLFVIGTVNMDDTTHQFSRKVIDRAFTIEMNGGKLEDMFNDENKMKLEYRQDGQEAKLELFKSNYTKATEAIDSEKVKPFAEVIKTEVPKLLNAVNDILAKTPFRVSYRVQNEMVLYICNAIENATEDIDINAVIGTAFLATLLEKILPRVQGDERLLKTAEGNVFTDLKKYVEQMQNAENTAEGETNFKALVVSKLDEMNDRLAKSYFASFFG